MASKLLLNLAKRVLPALAAACCLCLPLATAANAQVEKSQLRAANLARMEAERINGGLSKYFPANCMYQQGGGSCLQSLSDKGYLFNFLGGAPGWETNKQAATLQTQILVSPDGKSIKSVIYNGAPQGN
ncbi:hypothetical protein [Cyanobium sp. HWJ4-Hawea]|uniref:hypothetical protein n=1 Tax=Cyanobium sp. HWJ4-Hawea TaxID=2823713 RepID=UPI0020CDB440|nr:hypothetical protein [Cyanobium sp. HWJ4-Hawea]